MYGISRVSVVDVRAPAAYAQGHLPFAVNVPAETFRANEKDARKLAAILGASGVDPSHEAVIVSGGGVTKDAALAYVLLDTLGQSKVSIFTDSLESVDVLDRMSRKGFAVTKDATVVGKPQKPTDMGSAQIIEVLRGGRPARFVNPEVWPAFVERYDAAKARPA